MGIREMVQCNTNSTISGLELKPGPSGGRTHGTDAFLGTSGPTGEHFTYAKYLRLLH